MGAVAIHESEVDLVNQIREIEEAAAERGEMTEDELYRHERLNDRLIAMRLERWHPPQDIHKEVEKPKHAVIDDIMFEPDGQVYVRYDDSDSMTDYFNSYTLRQKHAIDWIKRDGADTIHVSVCNSDYDQAVRAKRFCDRLEKETGKKVNWSGVQVVMERYKDPNDAAKDWESAREKLKKIGLRPALYHEDSYGGGPGTWMIASSNIEWNGWRECTWALGPSALEDSGAHDMARR
jgi:hypothetical protein